MNINKNVLRVGIVGLLLLLLWLLACTGSLFNNVESDAVANDERVVWSHESGFYEEDVYLQVDGESIMAVYYTLDGTEPSAENPTAFVYEEGIYMAAEETESVYTIRALVQFLDGTENITNRTFVVGQSVMSRYDVPVVCIAAPDAYFWNEDIGRYDRDNRYRMKGRQWEEEVFATVFDSEGNVLLSQSCGHRIHGQTSRMKNQVSCRLRARPEYDIQDDFSYPLFDDCRTVNNTLVPEYEALIVRNSGNDNGYGMIRNELASRLSIASGFREAASAVPVAVYLNDYYYGFFWLENVVDEKLLKEIYGNYSGEMYMFEGQMDYIYYSDETDELAANLIEEYMEKMNFFSTCDLTQEENWQRLNAFMDVENFLEYVAIQHYIANSDSITNNYKLYRYVDSEEEMYTPNTVFDGRYRFILFDLDHAFGWSTYSHVEDLMTTRRLEGASGAEAFFSNLLKRKDCQETYMRRLLTLQNYYFSYDYASKVLEELHVSRLAELRQTYTTTDLLVDNEHSPDVTSDADIQVELDRMIDFLKRRPAYIYEDLVNCFGKFTQYSLAIANESGAVLSVDYATLHDDAFEGMYYEELPVSVTAQARPGYRFKHWLVNGEVEDSPELTVTRDMVKNGKVNLECVCERDETAGLYITAVKSEGRNDYIELTNLGTEDVYLNEYYLSDNDEWNQSPLPMVRVVPDEAVTIYCDNYTKPDALGQASAGFNIKEEETITLYKRGEVLQQTVYVPKLGTEDGVYRMDLYTGMFYEYR